MYPLLFFHRCLVDKHSERVCHSDVDWTLDDKGIFENSIRQIDITRMFSYSKY